MGTVVLADVTELETVKISELPSLDEAAVDDNSPIVANGKTQKITKAKFNKGLQPGRCAYVSPSFVNNEDLQRFSTVQAAIDFAYSEWGPITDDTNKVVIEVGPGRYVEQIHSYENMVLTSGTSGYAPLDRPPPVTIYNTGADAAHYPLRSDEDEVYEIIGINIETANVTNAVTGKIPNGVFTNCRFYGGDFIERDSTNLILFSDCTFIESDHGGFNLTGTNLTGNRNIILRNNCNLGREITSILTSTHTGWANFKCSDIDIEGNVSIGGDWDWRCDGVYTYRHPQRNTIDTTGEVRIVRSTMINGLHFVSDPLLFAMTNSRFEGISDNQIPDGEADITADVAITNATYSNNTQHNGISGKIQIQCPIKAIGCASLNKYFSIQDAIDSIITEGVVDLRESLTGLAELILPTGANVTIDGHKLYSLSFAIDIVELNASEELIFCGLKELNGGNIEVNGNSAYIGFEECLTVNAYITMTAGTETYCLSYTSTIKALTGHPAISIDNINAMVISGYSRIQGAAGSPGTPAISFNVVADNKFKGKFSTFIHGDKGASVPFLNASGSQRIIAMYNSGINAAIWSPSAFANSIKKAGVIEDSEIDF